MENIKKYVFLLLGYFILIILVYKIHNFLGFYFAKDVIGIENGISGITDNCDYYGGCYNLTNINPDFKNNTFDWWMNILDFILSIVILFGLFFVLKEKKFLDFLVGYLILMGVLFFHLQLVWLDFYGNCTDFCGFGKILLLGFFGIFGIPLFFIIKFFREKF